MAKRTGGAGDGNSKPSQGKDAQAGAGSGGIGVAREGTPYLVLARKYRPRTFDDLIGQEAMVRTLENAFSTGRLAQAYMLTGVRGVGKTTTARILARALNYRHGEIDRPTIDMPELGEHCAEIIESRHPDVIEMDAASNTGVENMREIIEGARYRPVLARCKVYIIDEVHMLSKNAFNALLKTLEEPPEHVKFIFATTEVRKVPVTVLSRCQRFDLRRVDASVLAQHFRRLGDVEGIAIDDEALALIARASEGSVRDGLSMLDQAFATSTGTVDAADVRAMLGLADRGRILDLLEDVLGGKAADALERFAGLHGDGAEPVQVLGDLAEAVHVITRIRVAGVAAATDTLSGEEKKRVGELAQRLGVALLSRAWQMLLKGLDEVGRSPDGFAAAEMVLIRLAHVAELPSPDDIARRLASGDFAPAVGSGAMAGGGAGGGAAGGKSGGRSGSGYASAGRGPSIALASDHAAREAVADGDMSMRVGTVPAALPNAVPAVSASKVRGQTGQARAHLSLVVDHSQDVSAQAVDADHPTAELGKPANALAPAYDETPSGASQDMSDDLPAHLIDADDPGFDPSYFDRAVDDEPLPVSGPQFMSFEGMVAFVGEKRDLPLKIQIEDYVRLVRFTSGRIEVNLKPGGPTNLLNELAQKLYHWTGERWVIALSREPGEPTLAERRDAELAVLKQLDPLKSALAAFPGAEITDVRDLTADTKGTTR